MKNLIIFRTLLWPSLVMQAIPGASSFSPLKHVFSERKAHEITVHSRVRIGLDAKKKLIPKAPNGFGAPLQKKKNPVKNKTRTVSGHTGSGTKPLRDAANTFDSLRKTFGSEACNDIYVRSPSNDSKLFWFVGKIARSMDESKLKGSTIPTVDEAILCQKRLILEYASLQLRPQNLGGPYKNNLEIWTAPGDSEMDAVQNKISLHQVTGNAKNIRDTFSMKDVGFNPEIYVGDEIEKGGLRIVRDEEGRPVKPVFSINDSVNSA